MALAREPNPMPWRVDFGESKKMDPNRSPDLARTTLQLLALARPDRHEPLDRAAISGRVDLGGNGRDCHVAAPAARTIVVWRQARPGRRADDRPVAADSGGAALLRNYDDHGERRADHGMVEIAGHAHSVPAARLGRGVAAGWRETRDELAETRGRGPGRDHGPSRALCSHSHPVVPQPRGQPWAAA